MEEAAFDDVGVMAAAASSMRAVQLRGVVIRRAVLINKVRSRRRPSFSAPRLSSPLWL
jgi:hypothetical protein|eukprot:COSAG01_NODE_536_length_15768_cov_58.648286_22_plen_58_part_00